MYMNSDIIEHNHPFYKLVYDTHFTFKVVLILGVEVKMKEI